jgi:hypothetical protein
MDNNHALGYVILFIFFVLLPVIGFISRIKQETTLSEINDTVRLYFSVENILNGSQAVLGDKTLKISYAMQFTNIKNLFFAKLSKTYYFLAAAYFIVLFGVSIAWLIMKLPLWSGYYYYNPNTNYNGVFNSV